MQVEMGLTWIDYETIDKPIEEIAQGTGEADEIQFHVETLKSDVKGEGKLGSNNLGKGGKKDGAGGLSIRVSFLEVHFLNILSVA